ncbi:ATP-binding protein [Kitasatospora sp. NPDC056651]|uniref:sensor histidine kinase n=1 Tax=Kitasatospora sp. NPDC056651 TaxID=3345892 RepID=UPI0036933F28
MADRPAGPDPEDLAAAAAYDERFAAFVDDLNRLHIEYGARSYGDICAAAQVFKLTKAGLADLLTGKRLPSVDFLVEFVRVVSNPVPADASQPRGHKANPELIDHWRRRWVDLRTLNRQVQSPLGRIRNATRLMVEEAARTAEGTIAAAEEDARQVGSRAEAEAAVVLEAGREQATRLVEAAREQAARLVEEAREQAAFLRGEANLHAHDVRSEADLDSRHLRSEAERARAEATRVAVARTAEADRRLRAATREAETIRQAAHAEAQEIVDEGRRVSRLRTPAALRELREAAEKIIGTRLPELIRTITSGDLRELDALTLPSVGLHGRDDVGRLARCVDTLHRELGTLAVEQALLRGSTTEVCIDLSRRTSGLIHRQLQLLEEMERHEAARDQLAGLFQLDHLATRMRRYCENLLVLAGADPGRRRAGSAPLVDAIRAAASEVEQYERIELAAVPSVEVAGRVVNDLVHLLAELLENAATFSHPQTRVRVTGHALPDGRVLVEIHDTGIGLSPDDLTDINEHLAEPPTVDVTVAGRLGLFVVGRLSLRHGVRVQLRPSDTGGTTALVMLPASSLVRPVGGAPGDGAAAREPGEGTGTGPAPVGS